MKKLLISFMFLANVFSQSEGMLRRSPTAPRPPKRASAAGPHRDFSASCPRFGIGQTFTWKYLTPRDAKKNYLSELLRENLAHKNINLSNRIQLKTFLGNYNFGLYKNTNPEKLIDLIAQEGLIDSELFNYLDQAYDTTNNTKLIKQLIFHGAQPNNSLVKKIISNQFNISSDNQAELVALCIKEGVKPTDSTFSILLQNLYRFTEQQQKHLVKLLLDSIYNSDYWFEQVLNNRFNLEPKMQEFIARLLIDSDRKTLSYLKRLIIGHFPLANEQRIRFIKLFLEKGLPIPSDSLENILTSCINHSLKEKLLDLLLSHQIRPSGSTLTTILKITEENDCIHFLSLIQPYCSPTDLYCSSQKVLKDIDSLKKQKKSLHFFMFQEKSNLQKIIEFYEKVVEILYRPVEKQECTFTSPSGQFYRVTATSVKDLQKIIEEENKEPECNTPLEKELYELYKKMKAKKIDPKEILKPATLDQKTLKISYYKLMQKYHPDKFSSNIRLQKAAHNVAVEINRAYEQLKDKC